ADRPALPAASPTAALAGALERAGRPHRLGTSWTTDAPYRETRVEAAFYQAEGVAAVDMEAAALFSVAAYRGAEMAAAFTISDSLAGLEWRPELHSEETVRGLETILTAALEALLTPGL